MDAIKASTKPVVATHSNVYSLVKTRRNLDDEQIKAIADKNGVIGMVVFQTCSQTDCEIGSLVGSH
jgi:membrane dipeptidase